MSKKQPRDSSERNPRLGGYTGSGPDSRDPQSLAAGIEEVLDRIDEQATLGAQQDHDRARRHMRDLIDGAKSGDEDVSDERLKAARDYLAQTTGQLPPEPQEEQ